MAGERWDCKGWGGPSQDFPYLRQSAPTGGSLYRLGGDPAVVPTEHHATRRSPPTAKSFLALPRPLLLLASLSSACGLPSSERVGVCHRFLRLQQTTKPYSPPCPENLRGQLLQPKFTGPLLFLHAVRSDSCLLILASFRRNLE